MEKRKYIPVLRFPEFDGEWKQSKLKDFASIKRGAGSQYLNYTNSPEEGIRLIRIGDFLGNEPVFVEKNKDIERFLLESDDILIAGTGATAGITFLVPDSFIGLAYSYNAPKIKVKEQEVAYVLYYLKSDLIIKQQNRLFTGNAQPFLDTNTIGNFRIFLPTLPEQQKIASFFTAIDQKISQLKKKHQLLEQYKKGVMQKIFSQQIRFKDDDGREFPKWEKKRLGEIGITYNGLSGKSGDDFGQGMPYIQYKQIFDSSRIDISKFGYVDIKSNEKQKKANFGDVFFTVSSETPNEVGMASVLLDEVDELYLNSFCFGYRASLNSLNPYFSRYLFRSALFRRDIIKLAQGSTRYNMSKAEFIKLETLIPCLPEQTKIANFLSAIDDKIQHTQKQVEQAEQWKKGLMQKMFV